MNEEFKKLIESVPDTYSDFISYMTHRFTDEDDIQKITDFINSDSDITTSKIGEFIADEFLKIPRIN